MQFRNRDMVDERSLLMRRIQGAIATRSLLQESVAARRGSPRQAGVKAAPRRRLSPLPGLSRQRTATETPPPPVDEVRTVTGRPIRPGKRVPMPERPKTTHAPQPETSTRTTQNALLWLGALLFAVTGTGYLLRELQDGARIVVFALLAVAILAAPLPIARRGLVSTAETLASVGLLFVLLEGYAIWATDALAGSGMSGAAFAGLVCLATAGVAAGYRTISHLVAPRFAGILLLQPVLPLLFAGVIHGVAGWSAILAAVGAQDLALAIVLRQRQNRVARPPAKSIIEAEEIEVAEEIDEHAAEGTPYLRDAVWILHGLAVLAAVVCAVVTLAGAHATTVVLGGAAGLLLAATVGLGGGLTLRRWPLPDVAAGLATAALICAIGRVTAVTLPGWGLVMTGLAILVAGVTVRLLGPLAHQGPRLAGALSAGVLALILLGRGFDAIVGPLRASSPAWHAHLGSYAHTVAKSAGPGAGQLALAAIILTAAALTMLPRQDRTDGAVAGFTLTLLLVPAGLSLPWAAVPLVLVLAAVALGAYALIAPTNRSSWVRIGAAAIVGCYAVGVALARPEAAALALSGLTIFGAAIGIAPRLAETSLGPNADRAAEAGWAGAAFALPGAVAFATAGTAQSTDSGPVPVLAASFLAVAGTLTATAVNQVARGRPAPLVVAGSTLGAGAVAVAAFVSGGVPLVDIGIAALLLISAVMLCLAPWMDVSRRIAGVAGGSDIAATAVTAASVAAVARVAGLLAPGYQLATAAVLVLLVAAGVRAMPAEWRRGPIVGGSLVGTVVGLIAGVEAVRGAFAALDAVAPVWHTDLAHWSAHISGPFGAQVPLALVLLAAAAAVALPAPASYAVSSVGIGLAALAAPAALDLPWWSPILFSGVAATGIGIAAGRSTVREAAWARYSMATVLFADTIGASLVRPGVTAQTLLVSTLILAAIAWAAATTLRAHENATHLVLIGGFALSAALATLPAGAACLALASGATWSFALTAALAGLCVGLAATAVACYNTEVLLPFATAGVALVGTTIAVITLATSLPLVVYAAAAALLAVLAELLRAAVTVRRDALPPEQQRGRPLPLPRRPGHVLMLAAGPATVLAAVALAPSVGAAVIGPYQWVESVWTGAPATSLAALGPFTHWVGDATSVAAALILTLAGALGAVGFGGRPEVVTRRAVSVVIPGLAITLLIAPYALRMPWPAGPVLALVVAVLAGLGLALTATPVGTTDTPQRPARTLVLVICLLAGGAGLAGSLATQSMTLWALAITAAGGVTAAMLGRSRTARVVGWLVTAFAGHLLALVAGLSAGLPVYWSAFLVALVAAAMLVVASLLPRLRQPQAASEAITVEASAYAGAVLALALAARSLPHLAVFTCAWGVVLSVAASRPNRPRLYRNALIWFAIAHELAAWFLLMYVSKVALPEAYTLAVAVAALVIGYLRARRDPDVSSWLAYGVALVAAFLPSLVIVLTTNETPTRRGVLIVGAAATVVFGSWRRQQAPVVVGGVALAVAALHELAVVSTTALLWTIMALVGAVLVGLGANFEKRRRDIQRLRGALGRLR
ncbi:SCO7613 C-terminal domain-containing membrane protein [Rugosimonospora africana]|nr:permease [Rugosimonospora africana]